MWRKASCPGQTSPKKIPMDVSQFSKLFDKLIFKNIYIVRFYAITVDISLYKDESQIEKKTPAKRKLLTSPTNGKKTVAKKEDTDEHENDSESDEDYRPLSKKKKAPKKTVSTPKPVN